MNKRILFLGLAALICSVTYAQKDDFGVWYTVNTDFGLSKKLDAGVSAELRTFRNAGTIEEGLIEAGLEYKLTEVFSAGASYRFASVLENDSRYHPEHKMFLETKASVKPGHFTLQARLKYQIRFRTYFEEVSDKIPDHILRVRLKTTYRTPSFPVNPWFFGEAFFPTYPNTEKMIEIIRIGAGADYNIAKNHSLELSYVFRRDYVPDIFNEHIMSLGYNFSF
jgi:hypothetical protein